MIQTLEEQNRAIWNRMDSATKWCLHYCLTHGVDTTVMWHVKNLALKEPKVTYTLVKNEDKNKFVEMATKLRELWPKGVRTIDGKEYAWRDTIPNLAARLSQLWTLRKLDKYTEEDVLQAARRYLSRYEDNKRFMKSVKYFILQEPRKEGFKQVNSILADMLENAVVPDMIDPATFNGEVWNTTMSDIELADGGRIV